MFDSVIITKFREAHYLERIKEKHYRFQLTSKLQTKVKCRTGQDTLPWVQNGFRDGTVCLRQLG